MKRDELKLGLTLLAILLAALFADPISHALNQPLFPRFEIFSHSAQGAGSHSLAPSRKVPVREELNRG